MLERPGTGGGGRRGADGAGASARAQGVAGSIWETPSGRGGGGAFGGERSTAMMMTRWTTWPRGSRSPRALAPRVGGVCWGRCGGGFGWGFWGFFLFCFSLC